MTSSRLQTLADGSPIPRYDTQSPKTVFTVGKIQTLGNIIYGYSGMVNFDVTASVTYPLLRFTLEKNAMLKCIFNADWDLLEANNHAIGVMISIDGINVIRVAWELAAADNGFGQSAWQTEFFLPAGRDCNIVVLNPDASAVPTYNSNINMVGQYV